MAIRAAQGAAFQRLHPPHSDDPAGVELVLHHDVLCSWCYLADARLDYLRDEYGSLLRWSLRPYPLRPENQIPGKKERSVLARHFRRVAREREGRGVKPDLWTGEDPGRLPAGDQRRPARRAARARFPRRPRREPFRGVPRRAALREAGERRG